MPQQFLVNIVSEQTLPNYLFIKEFEDRIDRFIFITSKAMESRNKTEAILKTAGINQKERRSKITVEEDSLYKIRERLNRINFDRENDIFHINLTGGTKPMAIAVWNFFRDFKNVKWYYKPITKNVYKEYHTDKKATETPFTYKISLKEYLSIYNLDFEQNKPVFDNITCRRAIYHWYENNRFNPDDFPFHYTDRYAVARDQVPGKCFEEFVFYKIKDLLKLNDQFIGTGIRIFDKTGSEEDSHLYQQNDNEIDILFLHNNQPYLIECKHSLGADTSKFSQKLSDYFYKLAAIKQRFGLQVKSTIFTLADLSQLSENARVGVERRAKLTGVFFPFDRNDLLDDENFQGKMEEFLK